MSPFVARNTDLCSCLLSQRSGVCLVHPHPDMWGCSFLLLPRHSETSWGAYECPGAGQKHASIHKWYLAWHRQAPCPLGTLGGGRVTHQNKPGIQVLEGSHSPRGWAFTSQTETQQGSRHAGSAPCRAPSPSTHLALEQLLGQVPSILLTSFPPYAPSGYLQNGSQQVQHDMLGHPSHNGLQLCRVKSLGSPPGDSDILGNGPHQLRAV